MVLVDDRAGSGDLVRWLEPHNVKPQLSRMDVGDVAFVASPEGLPGVSVRSIGIEVKAVGDLLNCIADGRFAGTQLPGLVRQYDHVWLVVEGSYRPNPVNGVLEKPGRRGGAGGAQGGWFPVTYGNRAWMWKDVEAWLLTMEIRAGIRVRRTFDRRETALFIATLYHWWQKDWGDHKAHLAFDLSRDSDHALLHKPSLLRRVAKELPGIGWTKSIHVDNTFPTVEDMINAPISRWKGIEGVGAKMATTIHNAIRTPSTRSR